MVKKDYYEILGVKKTDSADIIKKAYKKLALNFHPDKASHDKKKEHEEKFKEINEAYSILSDETKRKKYDSGERSPFNQRQSSQGGDFSDILRDLLRNGSFGNQFYEDEDSTVGEDLRYGLKIEFLEAVFGCEKEIFIKKDIACEKCSGTGAIDKKLKKCYKCNGQGRIKINQRTPFGVMSQTVRCDNCDGEGQIPENKCLSCDGLGILNSKEKVKVKIPAGIDDGQTLRINGGGNAIRNGSEGNLFLVITVKSHKVFRREGFDVHMETSISFSQAALGSEITIPTLSSEIKIKVASGTQSSSILRLRGQGIPFLKDQNHRGDQFINILVKTPKKLTKAQTKLFEDLAKLDK
jgi:molecular chaperone DnaJ